MIHSTAVLKSLNRLGLIAIGCLLSGACLGAAETDGPSCLLRDASSAAGASAVSGRAFLGVYALSEASSAVTDDGAWQRLAQKDASSSLLMEGEEASTPPIKLGGFLDVEPAYTYASPAHWSRGVARLQVTLHGDISEDVKWRLAGRIDVDPVYFSSGFYPHDVKTDQRFNAFYRENYLDFSAGDWDFRVGAQQIVWGEVVGLFFADVVSALDLREFLLPSFDIMRIPQAAARAEYTSGDSHLELIWIPVPAFDKIGKPGADFYPLPSANLQTAVFEDPVRPERRLSNSNYGVRANTLAAGWDVAAFYYRSFSATPTFYRLPAEMPDQPLIFEPRYDRIWQTGGTLSKDFSDFVLRAEAVYTYGQGYSVTDPETPQGVAKAPTLDYIVSFDFALPSDTRLNLQGFQRKVFGGGGGDFAIKSDGFGASVFVSTKLGKLEPQLLWIQNFKDAGGLIRPRLNWNAAKNTTIGFGVDIFTGPSDGFFGRFDHRDRTYVEGRYDF